MARVNVKELTAQLDAAQAILDDIRMTCGCEAAGPLQWSPSARQKKALESAERAYQDRRKRTDFVGNEDLFGEPAWDMLLDLFIRQTKQEEITRKKAYVNVDAPTPTMVRWLNVLEQNGLIESGPYADNVDERFIQLTPAGYEGMVRYFENIAL